MNQILAFIDFSDVTSRVLNTAGDVARAFHCKLDVIYVATPDAEVRGDDFRADTSREGTAHELHRIHREMQVVQKELRARGADATSLLVRSPSQRGNPVAKILEEVEQRHPDLIIMGTHGHGALYQLMVGSASDAVVRKARCPVVLVPSQEPSDKTGPPSAGPAEMGG